MSLCGAVPFGLFGIVLLDAPEPVVSRVAGGTLVFVVTAGRVSFRVAMLVSPRLAIA